MLEENKLITKKTGKTYISPSGVDTSTIDYIFFSKDLESKSATQTLDKMHTNVSDHYPVLSRIQLKISRVNKTNVSMQQSSKVKWDKMDKDSYSLLISQKVRTLNVKPTSLASLDCEIRKLNDILVTTTETHGPKKVRRHRKAKLKVYSPEIKQAIRNKKRSFLAVEER